MACVELGADLLGGGHVDIGADDTWRRTRQAGGRRGADAPPGTDDEGDATVEPEHLAVALHRPPP